MKPSAPSLLLLLVLWFVCCSTDSNKSQEKNQENEDPSSRLEVVNISVSGSENAYTFNVSLKSPDTGCEQYADWWEVLDTDGNLIYRRILTHSHVNEQPFTRSGGTVGITKEQVVFIRGHMNNTGYGSGVFKGSVANGFSSDTLDAAFAKDLENQEPLPQNCAF